MSKSSSDKLLRFYSPEAIIGACQAAYRRKRPDMGARRYLEKCARDPAKAKIIADFKAGKYPDGVHKRVGKRASDRTMWLNDWLVSLVEEEMEKLSGSNRARRACAKVMQNHFPQRYAFRGKKKVEIESALYHRVRRRITARNKMRTLGG